MPVARARVKLNLFLHVVGRRADGYHLLDSLVAFASIADMVGAEPDADLSLEVTGPFAHVTGPQADNLIWRAALALRQETGVSKGALLSVDKRIPAGAGLGGGSADAAATLRLLAHVWGVTVPPERLSALALGLGADVPVCLYGRPVRMGGVGEVIRPAPRLAPMALVLVHPGGALSTPAVFKALAGRLSSEAGDLPADLGRADSLIETLAATRNDLEAPALTLRPEIGEVLAALRAQDGCRIARMSGSGAASFGLFGDLETAEAAAARLAEARPQWWVRAGLLETD